MAREKSEETDPDGTASPGHDTPGAVSDPMPEGVAATSPEPIAEASVPSGEAASGASGQSDEPEPRNSDPEPEIVDTAENIRAEEPWRFAAAPVVVSPEPEPEPARPVSAHEPAIAAGSGEAAEAHEDHSHEEEPRGSSFAGKALTFLVLLIAGAAGGIWAAPKVAPMLPAGMAPVASWLMPGQSEAEAQIVALQTRLDEVAASVPTTADIEAGVQGLVEAAESRVGARLDSEIGAVTAAMAETDLTTATARIGQLETALDGVLAEFATIKDQIAAGNADAGAVDTAQLDATRAELEGLRAEVTQLSGAVSALGARLDEAEASAAARVAEAEQAAATVTEAAEAERDLSQIQAELAMIRAAFVSGEPFAEALGRLETATGAPAPEGLAAASGGVATVAQLRAGFSDAAHQAIRASIVASGGEGLLAQSAAFLKAQVASRSLEPQEGATPDAVLSRMEDALRRDDLAAALAEAESLPSEASGALGDWLAAARLRAAAEAGLAEASAAASTQN